MYAVLKGSQRYCPNKLFGVAMLSLCLYTMEIVTPHHNPFQRQPHKAILKKNNFLGQLLSHYSFQISSYVTRPCFDQTAPSISIFCQLSIWLCLVLSIQLVNHTTAYQYTYQAKECISGAVGTPISLSTPFFSQWFLFRHAMYAKPSCKKEV